jgi:hypothetical protein
MAETLAIVAIITGLGGCAVAILHTVRTSECCAGLCKLNTRTPPSTPKIEISPPSPQQKRRELPAKPAPSALHALALESHDV